jgi:hypothetical protein
MPWCWDEDLGTAAVLSIGRWRPAGMGRAWWPNDVLLASADGGDRERDMKWALFETRGGERSDGEGGSW